MTKLVKPHLETSEPDIEFDIEFDNGCIAHCWQAISQPYADCVFSAGLVEGIEPDVLYFMVKRDGQDEPYMLFLRPDEMQAVTWVCNGALWSSLMLEMDNDDSNQPETTGIPNTGSGRA